MSAWTAVAIIFLQELVRVAGELCETYEHHCEKPYRCCGSSCCRDRSHDDHYNYSYTYRWSIWNMWYFWFLVIFVLMSCFGGCGYWRRRQWMLANQQRTTSQPSYPSRSHSTSQYRTAMFGYSSPFGLPQTTTPAQPQGAFPSPPPYSEVINKPDVYPPKKEELPPYPGGPMPMYGEGVPAYAWLGGATPNAVDVPPYPMTAGLPPYTPVAAPQMPAPANQEPAAAGGPANQQPAQHPSNQTPLVSNGPTNQNAVSS